jgi:holo-ACP synthase
VKDSAEVMKDYTAAELLEAREKRVERIQRLWEEYKVPLLVIRVNYPGLKKTNSVTIKMSEDTSRLISRHFQGRICAQVQELGAEGPVFYVVLKEEAAALKLFAVEFEENHPLGRCLDLDVYTIDGQSISRQELGFPRRKCYLCDEDAQLCVRSRRHGEQEVIDYIEKRFRDYCSCLQGMGME